MTAQETSATPSGAPDVASYAATTVLPESAADLSHKIVPVKLQREREREAFYKQLSQHSGDLIYAPRISQTRRGNAADAVTESLSAPAHEALTPDRPPLVGAIDVPERHQPAVEVIATIRNFEAAMQPKADVSDPHWLEVTEVAVEAASIAELAVSQPKALDKPDMATKTDDQAVIASMPTVASAADSTYLPEQDSDDFPDFLSIADSELDAIEMIFGDNCTVELSKKEPVLLLHRET